MACLPSTCPFCACGCGVLLQEDAGRLLASYPSTAPPARSSLCIRGWHCTSPVSSPDRLVAPLIRGTSGLVPATWQEAVSEVAGRLASARSRPLFVVGPTVANEDAAAVAHLAQRLDGQLCTSDLSGASAARWALDQVVPGARGNLDPEAISAADLLWVIGLDTSGCPQVAGRVTGARRRGATVVRFDVQLSSADNSSVVAMPPESVGELGRLLERAARPEGSDGADTGGGAAWLSAEAARALVAGFRAARRPVAIVGGRWLSSDGAESNTIALLRALAHLGAADRVVFAVGESNSWGVLDVLGPGAPAAEIACRAEGLDTVVVVADDLVRRSPRPDATAGTLSRLDTLVVVDRFPTHTTARAHVVLPSCTFAEADGWVTSLFGEARPWRRIVPPPGGAEPERIWMARIGEALGAGTGKAKASPCVDGKAEASPCNGSDFPYQVVLSSHAAAFSTGVMTSRDDVLRREANESMLTASPAALKATGLKPGSPARLVVPGGEVTVTVHADHRIPDEVLVLVPLPGSAAAAVRGCYPARGGRTVGLQPVPARLERA